VANTELRVVTVLFADLVGFSTAAETAAAEATRALLETYFATCRTVVERYGGTIEKFIGDAVMAVWGYPVAGEDAAERAVRAGLDLIEAVEQPLRVGITTGTVAVASTGSATDSLVAGDTVNLAARIQQIALASEVWTDQATRDSARDSIDFEDRGEHTVKGRTRPVTTSAAIAVMGERGGRGRLDVLNVPLVGYKRELSAIKDALHATMEGERGRLVVVTGEGGTGKSRLGRELLNYADGVEGGIRWHSSRASALDTATPYGALEAAVRGRLGVTEHNVDELGERLDAHVREFVPDVARRTQIRRALGVLLGVGELNVSKQDLFIAWTAWFAALAGDDDTVVWVLDDAHFADQLLLDFIELLVTTVGSRLLVVLFARPDLLAKRPALVAVRGSSLIGLEGLNRAAMTELVEGLITDIPATMRDSLVASAGGLPLYAVEVVRGMIDRGELVVSNGSRVLSGTATTIGTATASLSGVVMSRLELLEPFDRRFLQQASVLGISFTVEQVAPLVEMTTDAAADGLARLAAKDLLRATNDTLSSEAGQHTFVQSLVQQVAYESLAKEERARLHLRAAEILSDSGADSGLVVEHVMIARSLDESAPIGLDVSEWLAAAAKRAHQTSVFGIAQRNFELAIETSTDAHRKNEFRLEASQLAIMRSDPGRAAEIIAEIVTDDASHLLRADLQRVLLNHASGRVREARAVLDRWPELPDGISNAVASRWAAAQFKLVMDMDGAAAASVWGDRALIFAELSGDPGLIHGGLNASAIAASGKSLGRVATALHSEGARFARANGLSYELTTSLNNVALMNAKGADLAGAASMLAEAIELSVQSGGISALVYPLAARIEYLCLLGRVEEAMEQVELGLRLFGEPKRDTIIEYGEYLQVAAWVRSVAGIPNDPSLYPVIRELTEDDIESLRTGSMLLAQYAVVADAPERTALARQSVDIEFELAGIGDGLPSMWPRAADINLDASDFAGLRSMFEYLPEIGDGPDDRYIGLQVRRMRASLEAVDPASTVPRIEVEVALRTSLEELELHGLVIDRARTLAVLGRFLESLGRASGAAAARQESAALLTECGALGLRRDLGL
jgi:class 3 adenylate cyclase